MTDDATAPAGWRPYAELPRPDDSGLPLGWVWGQEDELGTLNHITPERVAQAAGLVRRGVRFSLDLPLHEPFGVMRAKAHRSRKQPEPTMYDVARGNMLIRDDHLDEFFLQGSTQWDGLTHMGDALQGFYNGVPPERVTHGEGSRNGIDKVAAFGLAGRAVLADLPRHRARTGRPWDVTAGDVVSPDELAACLQAQGSPLQPGDVLLVRLGWVQAFRAAGAEADRDGLFVPQVFSGLSGQEDMWAYLWDRRVAAVAADTPTVEVWPPDWSTCSLHRSIPRLGLTLGEMFDLEALAADCESTGDFACMLTSAPLKLRGGVGSPPNAMALR